MALALILSFTLIHFFKHPTDHQTNTAIIQKSKEMEVEDEKQPMEQIKPRPHQQFNAERFVSFSDLLLGLLLFHHPGTGKTLQIRILVSMLLQKIDATIPILFVAPKKLLSQIQAELTKSPDCFPLPDFTLVNYEQVRAHPDLYHRPGQIVIMDEGSRIKNPTTQIYQVMQTICADASYVFIMTATPVENHPVDMACLLNLILYRSANCLQPRSDPMIQVQKRKSPAWHLPLLPETAKTFDAAYPTAWADPKLKNYLAYVSFHAEDAQSSDYKSHFPRVIHHTQELTMTVEHWKDYYHQEETHRRFSKHEKDPTKDAQAGTTDTAAARTVHHEKKAARHAKLFHGGPTQANLKETRSHEFLAFLSHMRQQELRTERREEMPTDRQDQAPDTDGQVQASDDHDTDMSEKHQIKHQYVFQQLMKRLYSKIQGVESPFYKSNYRAIIYSNFLASGIFVCERMLKDLKVTFGTIIGSRISITNALGQTKPSTLEQIRRLFQSCKIRVVLMTRAGSYGSDLGGADDVFLLDFFFTEAERKQTESRAIRYSSIPIPDKVVTVHSILVKPPKHDVKNRIFTQDKKTASMFMQRYEQVKSRYMRITQKAVEQHGFQRRSEDFWEHMQDQVKQHHMNQQSGKKRKHDQVQVQICDVMVSKRVKLDH